MASNLDEQRVDNLVAAFAADGFRVDRVADVVWHDGFVGMRATQPTALIGKPGKHKTAFFVEGDPHTMGYLMGRLCGTVCRVTGRTHGCICKGSRF